MSLVYIVMGYPASGKSTIASNLAAKRNAIILNRDSAGGKVIDLLPQLEQHIKDGRNVILDNLFPNEASRAPFIQTAQKLHAEINCELVNISIEDAQFNFVQRAIGILGKFPTPEAIKEAKHPNIFPPAVMFKYRKEFQTPAHHEGFRSIACHDFQRKDDPTFTNKAIILDYDGTLRDCVNGNGKYPVAKDQIQIKINRKKVLDSYRERGYLLLGMSNQSGIHKGELTDELAHKLFQHTNHLLDVDIEYNFCPHQSAPISCWCRKPMCGRGVDMILKHKLNRKDCIMVGDFTSDQTFAERCGFQYVDQAEFFK